jgi:G:T-mismatch repair DNA endonuclease (very short patch repair protein)
MDMLIAEHLNRYMALFRGNNSTSGLRVLLFLHDMGHRFWLKKAGVLCNLVFVFFLNDAVIFVNGCLWHPYTGCKCANTQKLRKSFKQNILNPKLLSDQQVSRHFSKLDTNHFAGFEFDINDYEFLNNKNQGIIS